MLSDLWNLALPVQHFLYTVVSRLRIAALSPLQSHSVSPPYNAGRGGGEHWVKDGAQNPLSPSLFVCHTDWRLEEGQSVLVPQCCLVPRGGRTLHLWLLFLRSLEDLTVDSARLLWLSRCIVPLEEKGDFFTITKNGKF